MERITSFKLCDYCSVSQIKKRLKNYLIDINYSEYKINNFGQSLVLTLVSILEEIITDSLRHVTKHEKNGLYLVNNLILRLLFNESNKYDFTLKYLKKFDSKTNYQESLFFNMKKVLSLLEKNLGDKLMIDFDAKNMISFLLLTIQYEITKLSLMLVRYGKKKTLSKDTLVTAISFLLDEQITGKVKLKLDCELQEVADSEVDEDELNNDKLNNDEVNEINDKENISDDDDSESSIEIKKDDTVVKKEDTVVKKEDTVVKKEDTVVKKEESKNKKESKEIKMSKIELEKQDSNTTDEKEILENLGLNKPKRRK